MKHVRVLVADDHPLVGGALETAVRAAIPNAAVDVVHSLTEAEARVRNRTDFDLVLLDLMLPDTRGFSGLLLLQQLLPGKPIAIVSAKDDPDTIGMAWSLGAAGFMQKSTGLGQIGVSIGQIMQGDRVFPATRPTTRTEIATTAQALAVLTPAQTRVMLALADGRANKQIAYDLGLSEATVKVHVSASLKKLGVPNRGRAMLLLSPLVTVD